MTLIILIIAALVLVYFPTLRCALLHPVKLTRYGVSDLIRYIRFQRWNECQTGELVADRKSTRLNSSHSAKSRMPSSA